MCICICVYIYMYMYVYVGIQCVCVWVWSPFSIATGQTLRCDVFVDTIHRIEITTRTRELLLEEEPERFEILGFDEEG